jgi:hypothetical protein
MMEGGGGVCCSWVIGIKGWQLMMVGVGGGVLL